MDLERIEYALDANVLISAYRDHYPPDLFPGVWDSIAHHITAGRLLIIDRIRAEIIGPSGLVQWLDHACSGSYVSTVSQPVVATYGEMADWVHQTAQFSAAASEEFARDGDGWLAAYASVTGAILVTNEVFRPDARRRVPLPNLCRQFNVSYLNMLGMLRNLDMQFDWRQPQ